MHVLDDLTIPLVTAMESPGVPSAAAAEPLLAALARGGATSLMLLGSNGEGALLPTSSIASYLSEVTSTWRALRPRGRVVINVSAAGTAELHQRASIALAAEPDALVVSPPGYFRHRDDEIVQHIRSLEQFGVPLVVYNVPSYANPLSVEAFEALAESPQVIGIKDSSGDLDLLKSFVEVAARHPGLAVAQGNETLLLAALQAGAVGVVPGLGNIAPALVVDVIERFQAGDFDGAERSQHVLTLLTGIHQIRRGVPSVKAILGARNLIPVHSAAPLAPCTEAEIAELQAFLEPFSEHLLASKH
jgi:4-hydroxy-tetrahydrodipicolinate synthase